MQRLAGVEGVKAAVAEGRVVVACAYPGHIPELGGQLPAPGTPFVARVVDGAVTQVVTGVPERAVLEMIRNVTPAR